MNNNKEWYEQWFDSSYYHILYKNRDLQEADSFIKNLVRKLSIKSHSKILDLACGKGRHSQILNQLNMNVTGVDLSENSINEAKKFENKSLQFHVHDMREIHKKKSYDYIFNLFTSFGYFETMNDNIKMLDSISKMLLKNGILIIDFFNAQKVMNNLVPEETKRIDGVEFKIKKYIQNKKVFKEIHITDKNNLFFMERVQLFNLKDFKVFLKPKFKILHTFGDFDLKPFDIINSNRLIIIAQLR